MRQRDWDSVMLILVDLILKYWSICFHADVKHLKMGMCIKRNSLLQIKPTWNSTTLYFDAKHSTGWGLIQFRQSKDQYWCFGKNGARTKCVSGTKTVCELLADPVNEQQTKHTQTWSVGPNRVQRSKWHFSWRHRTGTFIHNLQRRAEKTKAIQRAAALQKISLLMREVRGELPDLFKLTERTQLLKKQVLQLCYTGEHLRMHNNLEVDRLPQQETTAGSTVVS